MTKRHNRTGRSTGTDRYLALRHWMMRTDAWRSLDCVARCAYIEMAARYAGPGSNNGRLPYSLREMAQALNVSKMTALRAFQKLQERGFIVETKRGAFSLKFRHATEWRLTEFGDDRSGALATKDFAHWKKQGGHPLDTLNGTPSAEPIECSARR
jgi:DNA-binding transcriptional MocR family regulator